MTDAPANTTNNQIRSIFDRIEANNDVIDKCNKIKAALYKEARAAGFDPRTRRPLPRKERPAKKADVSYQPPRAVGLFEQRLAYSRGEPVSQDFTFQDATIYFISFPALGRLKIGITNNLKRRKKDLESGSGAAAEVLHTCRGNKRAEAAFHERFSDWRTQGEWFTLNSATADLVASIAATHVHTQEAA